MKFCPAIILTHSINRFINQVICYGPESFPPINLSVFRRISMNPKVVFILCVVVALGGADISDRLKQSKIGIMNHKLQDAYSKGERDLSGSRLEEYVLFF